MELSRFVKWGLSNVTYDKSRHSAECTNADDIFGAYGLSCHLVIRMKTTTSKCSVDHSEPTRRIRAAINEVDWFAICDDSVYLERRVRVCIALQKHCLNPWEFRLYRKRDSVSRLSFRSGLRRRSKTFHTDGTFSNFLWLVNRWTSLSCENIWMAGWS